MPSSITCRNVSDNALLVQLATLVLGAGAVFGGIRAELKAMREEIQRLGREADEAHRRIDSLTGAGRRRND